MLDKIKKIFHWLTAEAAYWFYGRPARKMVVIGVTGTKGKSTVSRFVASVLEAAGHKVGLMTTVEFQVAEKRWPNERKMTMLGRGEIQKLLRQMVKAGCQYAVVETSSEGILQYRHLGLLYDIVVFTNLGEEHSERHGGFENLKRDKGRIFAELKKSPRKVLNGQKIPKIIIANADDPQAEYFLNFAADEKWGYGLKVSSFSRRFGRDPDFTSGQIPNSKFVQAKLAESSEHGQTFLVDNSHFKLNILGPFNIPNALAAIAVGRSQGISDEKIAAGLAAVTLVPGRMEFIDEGQLFKVVVDYAHEPMSLTELFNALRQLVGPDKKIISVVGSDGGGRDKSKREKMGEIAGRLTNIVVVTDVNCFDEDPKQIAETLAIGARRAGKQDSQNLFIEIDRRKGIEKAISLANAGDVVAITAKGTEPCIVVAKGKKIPWDDRNVARSILRHAA